MYNRTMAFKRRYKKYDQKLFENTLDHNTIQQYKDRWKIYGEKVEINTFLLCYNLSNKIDYNIVPENLFAGIIERRLNPHKELSFFSVKNIYEKWFSEKGIFPKTYFHRIDNVFYDREFKIIDDVTQFIHTIDIEFPIIIKPSKDTYGGKDVRKISSVKELLSCLYYHNHYVVQEFINQNSYLNSIYPDSINSIRSCLFRRKDGDFVVLNHAIRFGVDGSLDNLSSGGIQCFINQEGKLNDYALSQYGVKYLKHPNSKTEFRNIEIPNFGELDNICKSIANEIPLCNLVSLDMCLDQSNKWRCLEINLRGQTIRFPQYAGIGFFGKYTQDVIDRTIR